MTSPEPPLAEDIAPVPNEAAGIADLFRAKHVDLVRLARLPRRRREVLASADPSGRHLLLSYYGVAGGHVGWIGDGTFHRLPAQGEEVVW